MAPKPKPVPLFLFLLLLFLLFTAFPQQIQSSISNSTTSFSLELYSREALFRHQHYSTTSLALSTPVVSGRGEYFARVGIGSPARQFYVVLDTGSDLNWVQCSPCDDCYEQDDGPVFDPSESSTYSPLPCDSPQCDSLDDTYFPSCPADRCIYNLSYHDDSYSVGDLSKDTFTLGSSAVPDVVFGCGHDNDAVFAGAAGFLGLGRGPLSLASQIKASSFSYCLSDEPSTLDFNSASLGPGAVTAPILSGGRVETFYYIGLTGISVGGRIVSLRGNGGTIIDSGTTLTRLPDNAYVSLRDAFIELTANLTRAKGDELLETCYSLSSTELEGVPAVSFHFSGGNVWDLPVRNYLIPVNDSNGTFCFAFGRADSSMSIIGNVQQQGTLVTYDLANSLVGFTAGQC